MATSSSRLSSSGSSTRSRRSDGITRCSSALPGRPHARSSGRLERLGVATDGRAPIRHEHRLSPAAPGAGIRAEGWCVHAVREDQPVDPVPRGAAQSHPGAPQETWLDTPIRPAVRVVIPQPVSLDPRSASQHGEAADCRVVNLAQLLCDDRCSGRTGIAWPRTPPDQRRGDEGKGRDAHHQRRLMPEVCTWIEHVSDACRVIVTQHALPLIGQMGAPRTANGECVSIRSFTTG